MRLIVARCEVRYSGRLDALLPEAIRLLTIKADGMFMVWADNGRPNVKPLNETTTVQQCINEGVLGQRTCHDAVNVGTGIGVMLVVGSDSSGSSCCR